MTYDRKFEPTVITQGERIAWTRTFDDFPATLYTLEYRFRGNGVGFNVTATADGTDFNAVVTAVNSLAAAVGPYRWQAWFTEIAAATNINMIAEGTVEILRGFTTSNAAAVDLRTPAKIMLDTIDAALLAFATSDVLEYEITTPAGSRRVKKSDKMSLTSERKYWANKVALENARERVRNGGSFGSQVKVRMYDND